MITITKIAVGVKNKNRYNIYIDKGKGEEYGFSVSEDVLLKMNLKKGMEIDELAVMEIAYQEDIQRGFSDALHYLAHRMRSEAEIVRKLKDKEYEDHIIKEVIHKLYTLKFLNDEDFAVALVNTRINAADKGPVIIAQELKQKGVSDTFAEAALALYTREKQIEHAEKHINKLLKNKTNASTIELKRKVEQTLIRKGYSSYIIEEALQTIQISQDEDQEWKSIQIHGEKALRRYSKYTGYEFQQKMKSALYRKGFPIELIERYVDEIQQEIGE